MNYVNSRTTLGLIMSVTAITPWDPNLISWSNRSHPWIACQVNRVYAPLCTKYTNIHATSMRANSINNLSSILISIYHHISTSIPSSRQQSHLKITPLRLGISTIITPWDPGIHPTCQSCPVEPSLRHYPRNRTIMSLSTWQELSWQGTHPRDPNRLSNLPESPKSPHYNYKLVREL